MTSIVLRTTSIMSAVLLCSLPVAAQDPGSGPVRDETPESLQMDLLTFAGQNPDSSRLDAYVHVGYDLLSFVKAGDKYAASYEMTLTLSDSTGTQVAEKTSAEHVSDLSFDETVSATAYQLLRRSMPVIPGRYSLTCTIRDLDSRATVRIARKCQVRRIDGSGIALSDLMLLSKVVLNGPKRSITPNISGNVGNFEEPFGIFFELYAGALRDSIECFLVVTNSADAQVYKADTVLVSTGERTDVILQVPHDSLALGDYVVKVALAPLHMPAGAGNLPVAAVGRPIIVRWRGMPRSVKDIDLAIEQVMYIARESEIAKLHEAKTLAEKQRAFFEFWKKRDPNPSTPRNEKMLEFYARVDYANKHFSHYREGWRTDMGMVYIVLGPPSSIDRHPFEMDSKPYEVWSYFDLNFSCVFLDQTGFGDYRLLTPITDIFSRRRE